jgi:hypothetical protein
MTSPDPKKATKFRLEGIALGEYYAVRSILYAVTAIVGLVFTGFAYGFVAFADALIEGWDASPWIPLVMGFIGMTWFVVALAKSLEAFIEHQTVHQRLLALQPYTAWADQSQSFSSDT